MAGIFAEIHQISALLYATNKSSSKSLVKALAAKPLSSLLVFFSDLELSNIAELSESNL